MNNITCPICGSDMTFEILDEQGAHYECRNCDHELCDTSIKADIQNEEEH